METLEQIYKELNSNKEYDIPNEIKEYIAIIGKMCSERKGVYTVLVTLLHYKYIHPEQDIRYFQSHYENGFSARSYDTKFITPTLKKLGLPAMSESGWLTRSLEQPYPYDFNYKGAIPKLLKIPFLCVIDFVQNNPIKAKECLCYLLQQVKNTVADRIIHITPLVHPEKISIENIMLGLKEHFLTNYHTKGGAKLPVLAFHSIYTSLITEIARYKDCRLADLSSLTACDRTNKASGDIEIFNSDGSLFEAIEIKLNKQIDKQIIRVVKDKIYKWNPQRYYVLSVEGIKNDDKDEITTIVNEVAINHGCQIIINGLLPTIKYYLRLITSLENFVKQYSDEIEKDTEIQMIHKNKWNEILSRFNNI